ncbi:50S ribosomal protein L18e [Candidatus Pacearchaeota archaeon CG10_big_fil_rev_8_21_14_0_10_32_14]|nr:MAG: 50S ribosomal protein L18e [Candidatus Pacearchaeota archaeon CG10_big_fil_rev_8_21_14_0_10_32_14]
MISKTQLSKRTDRKNNTELVETINLCKKTNNETWNEVAKILSGPTRLRLNVNLDELNSVEGELIVIPGKVLSSGNLTKKKKIVALSFSGNAKEKLNKDKIEYGYIKDEVKKNQKGEKIVIFKRK